MPEKSFHVKPDRQTAPRNVSPNAGARPRRTPGATPCNPLRANWVQIALAASMGATAHAQLIGPDPRTWIVPCVGAAIAGVAVWHSSGQGGN